VIVQVKNIEILRNQTKETIKT